MVDPGGISNWSVTHVDWSEGKWHPRSYRAIDVTYALLKNITVCSTSVNGHMLSALCQLTCPLCVDTYQCTLLLCRLSKRTSVLQVMIR